MIISEKVPLKDLNWWKVGGEAEYYSQPETIEELRETLAWALDRNQQVHIFSGGSNVLIQDGLLMGLTICLHKLCRIEQITERQDRLEITCLAGTPKSELAKVFLQKRLAPAVFLTGIPGDVGGGVVMNAGVGESRVPREFCEIVDWIDVMSLDSLQARRILAKDLIWDYRSCKGWEPGIIFRVQLSWPNQPDASVMNQVREATKKRVATQPLNQPSCGSVFRNPPGQKSARLIEEAGLKGFSMGGAQVSERHANFIVNRGGATALDIHKLIQHVQQVVKSKAGVDLHPEVKHIGQWN